MKRFTVNGVTGEQMAKRMLKLAWDASGVFGMGAFQDCGPGLTEDQLWKRGCDNCGPHRGGMVTADYLFGRMMKLTFTFGDDFVSAHAREWRPDYQSFCRKYADFTALVNAAAKSLGAIVSEAATASV